MRTNTKQWLIDLCQEKKSWREKIQHASKGFSQCNLEHLANGIEKLLSRKEGKFLEPRLLSVLLSAGNPEHAVQHLEEFCIAFLESEQELFDWNQPQMESFLRIFGNSYFLTRQLIHQPQWALEVLQSEYLKQSKPLEQMQKELRGLLEKQSTISLSHLKDILRQYKYREYLRITIRDLGNLGEFVAILDELSSIAIACSQYALQIASVSMTHPHFTTQELVHTKPPFSIIGMGKLGGNELNYSSDIDLIFVYHHEVDQKETWESKETRLQVARRYIEIMSDQTSAGFLARIDMRLRPGGEVASLVNSIFEAEKYYRQQGALWEKQALIKARGIAGDQTPVEMLLRMLKPLIYSKVIDEHLLQGVQTVKSRIETQHLKENLLNVKLGVGGIREIEFFVQIFQLLYGGMYVELTTTNTLVALQQLQEKKLVSPADVEKLERAYLFLRKVEHRLQTQEEQQLHTLSSEVQKQKEIARMMGYLEADVEVARRYLLEDLRDTMLNVRSIFGSLFDEKHLEIQATICLNSHYSSFSSGQTQQIEELSRQLSPLLRNSSIPLLETRFQRFFEKVGSQFDYYQYLTRHPSSLKRLVNIAESSEFLWNHLLNHLELLALLEQQDWEYDQTQWERELSEKIQALDEESQLDFLREYKHTMTFLIGSAELDGLLSYPQAREKLTALAEVILQTAFSLSYQWVKSRLGTPMEHTGKPATMAIVAMGKFGGKELTYHSDLDLVFVYSAHGMTQAQQEVSTQQFYVKVVQRLISVLSTYTKAGSAYQLDTRLRPSGNAGVLVSPLQAYLQYHHTSKPWEHQALIKARMVGGHLEENWVQELSASLQKSAFNWNIPENLAEQISKMRLRKEKEVAQETANLKNLKEGFGGMLDVEFLTQYLQLQYGQRHQPLQTPQTLSALHHLAEHDILTKEEKHTLTHGYTLLRQMESYLRLLFDESTNTLDFNRPHLDWLSRLLQQQGYEFETIQKLYAKTTQQIREIFLQHLP